MSEGPVVAPAHVKGSGDHFESGISRAEVLSKSGDWTPFRVWVGARGSPYPALPGLGDQPAERGVVGSGGGHG